MTTVYIYTHTPIINLENDANNCALSRSLRQSNTSFSDFSYVSFNDSLFRVCFVNLGHFLSCPDMGGIKGVRIREFLLYIRTYSQYRKRRGRNFNERFPLRVVKLLLRGEATSTVGVSNERTVKDVCKYEIRP